MQSIAGAPAANRSPLGRAASSPAPPPRPIALPAATSTSGLVQILFPHCAWNSGNIISGPNLQATPIWQRWPARSSSTALPAAAPAPAKVAWPSVPTAPSAPPEGDRNSFRKQRKEYKILSQHAGTTRAPADQRKEFLLAKFLSSRCPPRRAARAASPPPPPPRPRQTRRRRPPPRPPHGAPLARPLSLRKPPRHRSSSTPRLRRRASGAPRGGPVDTRRAKRGS